MVKNVHNAQRHTFYKIGCCPVKGYLSYPRAERCVTAIFVREVPAWNMYAS